MQKNNFNLDQIIKALSPYAEDFSDEKVKELEWFIKLEALKAVNDKNKAEFQEILINNDMEKFTKFIFKYVPDIRYKLINFFKEN